jgi:hypothetical protein
MGFRGILHTTERGTTGVRSAGPTQAVAPAGAGAGAAPPAGHHEDLQIGTAAARGHGRRGGGTGDPGRGGGREAAHARREKPQTAPAAFAKIRVRRSGSSAA